MAGTVSPFATVLWSMASTPLQTGDTVIPQTAVTGYTSELTILLNQVILSNTAATVMVTLEASFDGGITWIPFGSSSHTGHSTQMGMVGVAYSFNPNFVSPSVLSSIQVSPKGTPPEQMEFLAIPTHFRGTITVGNGPLSLSGSISVQ